MERCNNYKDSILLPNPITQVADMPYPLYLSLHGKYFVGYADDMEFNNQRVAWAGLINPIKSGVNLYVYVWTVTNTGQSPLTAQVWFNTIPPGQPMRSNLVTPANTALCPLPKPKVKIFQANNAMGEFECGDKVFVRKVDPEVTIASDDDGRFIFPPGGSFIIYLSNSEASNQTGAGRVAFGWSEEKIR